MRIPLLGLTVSRTKAAVGVTDTSLFSRGWTRILESFPGAWQRNIVYQQENVVTYAPVYSCVTLIASDIAKLRIRLVEQDAQGIWEETESGAFSPVLKKPNRYQTRIQFFEQWIISKLLTGNAYVLKQRDQRGVVVALYVLDPNRVNVKVSPGGAVFYDLSGDNLTGLNESVTVPASEIIHDVMVPLYHPLCGVSPITACGLAAVQGLNVQNSSARFFGNDSRPSGVLTAPTTIPDETAARLQREWQANYAGDNFGKVAVLGNGLEYKAMAVTAQDAQLIEQLKWTAENVCTAFHVPAYMIGVGSAPTYNNIEALSQQYYSQCLQVLIESIELLLDEGLGLIKHGERQTLGTEFDLDDLLRMDSASRVTAAKESANGGGMTFNEVRKKYHGLGPVPGGDAVLSQQQNYDIAALAKRDAKADPFATQSSIPAPALPDPQPRPSADDEKRLADLLTKELMAVSA